MADRRYSDPYYQAIAKELEISLLDTPEELAFIESEAAAIGIQDINSQGDVRQFYSSNGYAGPVGTRPESEAERLERIAREQQAANERAAAEAQAQQQAYIDQQIAASTAALQANNDLLNDMLLQQQTQFDENMAAAQAAQDEQRRQFGLQLGIQQQALMTAENEAAAQRQRAENLANAFIPNPETTATTASFGDYRRGASNARDASRLSGLSTSTGLDTGSATALSGLILA